MKVKDAYMQAFPFIDPQDDSVGQYHGGMSKREYIAVKAMQAILGNSELLLTINTNRNPDESASDNVAKLAYHYADSMMKAGK